jgi:hypothetical protein
MFSSAATTVTVTATASTTAGDCRLPSIVDSIIWTIMDDKALEIGVIGPGAVGITIGGLLRAAGHRVTFYRRASVDAPDALVLENARAERTAVTGCSWSTADRWNPATELAFMCVRGDQLAAALKASDGRGPRDVPLAVAAATLDPVTPLARVAGWRGPILRLGVGFGAWRREDGVHRWFPMLPMGSGLAHEGDRSARSAGRMFARVLGAAGLTARAAPWPLYRWLMLTSFAVQTAQCLGFAQAGWSLEALADDSDLVARTAAAMKQAARAIGSEGGPLGLAAALAPTSLYRRMLRALPRRVSVDAKEVWRHHGPKIWPQVRFLSNQVLARAARRDIRTDALVALAMSGGQ